jgi:hypothetical protein
MVRTKFDNTSCAPRDGGFQSRDFFWRGGGNKKRGKRKRGTWGTESRKRKDKGKLNLKDYNMFARSKKRRVRRKYTLVCHKTKKKETF